MYTKLFVVNFKQVLTFDLCSPLWQAVTSCVQAVLGQGLISARAVLLATRTQRAPAQVGSHGNLHTWSVSESGLCNSSGRINTRGCIEK